MKKNIVFATIIIVILLIIVYVCFLYKPNEAEITYTPEQKQELLKNISIENQNTLTIENKINISGEINNNNSEKIKIKKIKVTMTNEAGEQIENFDIKIDKIVKGNSKIKFNKIIALKQYEPRVFTEYEVVI